jgi:nucleotide-binding universal stress UspA family protein
VAGDLPAGVPARIVVDRGDPAMRLATLARELDAAAVALGSVDRSPLMALLAGSVAERLIGSGTPPVLLVP